MAIDIREFILSPGAKYVTATLVGFLVAFLVERLNHYIEDQQTRRVLREVLARELIGNLQYLDDIAETLVQNVTGENRVWRSGDLSHAVLERCVDPSIGGVLTETEWIQAIIGAENTRLLNRDLKETSERVHLEPTTLAGESKRVLDEVLPAVAQTYVDLLCNILSNQVRYVHSGTQEVSLNIKTAWQANALDLDRTWRTSTVPEGGWPKDRLIVWRNDQPDFVPKFVPKMVQVVELRPTARHSHARSTPVNDACGRIFQAVMRRRVLRELERESKQWTNNDDYVRPIKRISDSVVNEKRE